MKVIVRLLVLVVVALGVGVHAPDADARKIRYPVRSESNELVLIACSFAPNAGSAVDQTTIRGSGCKSVTRTGVGVFNVKLYESYKEFIGPVGLVNLNAAADTDVQGGVYAAATSTTDANVDIKIMTAGVAADIAANANNRISFVLLFRHTAMPR